MLVAAAPLASSLAPLTVDAPALGLAANLPATGAVSVTVLAAPLLDRCLSTRGYDRGELL